jgi:glyceraldehyde-3-phosphate dehydrogenase/erythrose-4-phosphate dehydrogenase
MNGRRGFESRRAPQKICALGSGVERLHQDKSFGLVSKACCTTNRLAQLVEASDS